MGECESAVNSVAAACQETIDTMVEAADDAMRVQTPGGVFSVRWDERGSATALGQLAFFAEYLETTGLFEAWLRSCPLSYTSPNAPALVDVLGTWMRRSWTGIVAMRMWAHCAAMAWPRASWG